MAQQIGLSPAGQQLGLGDLLADQVSNQTDELRKKRMTQLPGGAGARAMLASPVSLAFGGIR